MEQDSSSLPAYVMKENYIRRSEIIIRCNLKQAKHLRDLSPRYVFIENVPQFVETYISVSNEDILITDYIVNELSGRYEISVNVFSLSRLTQV